MNLFFLCLLCAPAEVHCHRTGGQENCFVRGDGKPHTIKAPGLPPQGILFNGKAEWGFSMVNLPLLTAVEIDGKRIKVKR